MSSVLKKLSSLRDAATPEEKFIRKGAGSAFTISYETEITQESPGPKIPPYHKYNVRLKLSYADGRRERNYKTEIANGTMTQRVESIVSDAARNAIREKIPTLLELFKKYGSSYQMDGKTKKLLQADAHFVNLEEL
ncbi:MAG: hypothetical protein ABSF09_00065 [Candidatus Bathyarchaeia archaeon]|jgi:hypothetical protein